MRAVLIGALLVHFFGMGVYQIFFGSFVESVFWEKRVYEQYFENKSNTRKAKLLKSLSFKGNEYMIVDRGSMNSIEVQNDKNRFIIAADDYDKDGIIDSCKSEVYESCSSSVLSGGQQVYTYYQRGVIDLIEHAAEQDINAFKEALDRLDQQTLSMLTDQSFINQKMWESLPSDYINAIKAKQ